MRQKISSLWESYKITQRIADKSKKSLTKSYRDYVFSYFFQGLAFATFYPLLDVMLNEVFILNKALFWLSILLITMLISLYFRWFALNFSYTSEIVEVTHRLRLKLGKKIKNIPLQKLSSYRTGELNSILAQNVDDSVLHMSVVAGMAFEALIVPIVIIAATFFIDTKMALAILLVLPISIPIYFWSRKSAYQEKEDNVKVHATLEADTIEYLQGLPVLRSINQVGKNSKQLQSSINKTKEIQKQGLIGSVLPVAIMNTLIEFVFLMILVLGVHWITYGNFTIASLIALLIIVNRTSEPLANFLVIASVLDIMEFSFKRIEEILNIEVLKLKKPKALPQKFDITFENVHFSYLDQNQSVLHNVNLTIPSKALSAIVGSSGSGKTTLTRMIMRYDDPHQGRIKIGGIDIRQMNQNELMSYISVVFQDVYLFDDTILNNIRMGNQKASDEEVKIAAQKAHCHEFIARLPHGYETKVGEIGGSLSGGERQRISIARAILKDAPIVILDEPTSALDTQSEVAVQKALDELIASKTVIVIAHRLSTIAHADKIFVIDEGRVAEEGTHKELLEQKGKYSSMYDSQQRVKSWNL